MEEVSSRSKRPRAAPAGAGVPRGSCSTTAQSTTRCFQCEQCKCQLTALNVAAFDGKIFCKTHFHERLAHAGGKYDKAFRETTEAEEKEGRDKGSSKGDEKKKKKKKDNNNNNNNNKTSVKSMAAKTNASSAKDASKNGCVVCETTVYAAEAVNAVVGNKKHTSDVSNVSSVR